MPRRTRTIFMSVAPIVALAGTALSPALGEAQNGAGPAVAQHADATPSLALTNITLYRSGVGYFLRQGQITGNSRVSLQFDVNQINDVLKSLQVLDMGGRVESVSYPSKDPLARRMASFGLQIGDNPSMVDLLSRLRGATVTLTLTDTTVSGSVLSVEVRRLPGGTTDRPILVDTPMVNLVTGSGIRSVPIPSVLNFQIADKALADELNRALAALGESRAERTKTIDVLFSGADSRRAAIAYVHETPVWKTSYRLVLPESDQRGEAARNAQGFMQGWALVENTTDQDWSNVRLSLVSGRPVSFRMDLFEPLYVFRPEVPVPTVAGVMPRTFEGGMDNRAATAARPASPPAPAAAMARRGAGAGGAPQEGMELRMVVDSAASSPFLSGSDLMDYGARAQATGGDVGETFQYTVDQPVTIERQRSAMIPIISANVGARRVSIYNMSDRPDHPMRGLQLTNATDLQLLPGPLAVFDGASYAGDAQINQVAAGDKRLIAFAVDLDVAVQTMPEDNSVMTRLRIVDGSFELTTSESRGVRYTFDNKDLKRSRTIIVEHPKFDGWELKAPFDPEESTQSLHRFAIEVDAGKKSTLAVSQQRVVRSIIGIFDYDLDTLLRFNRDGKFSADALAAVREIFARRQAVTDQERVIADLDRQLNALKSDQTRISQMLGQLDRQSETYHNLLQKVNRQERDIDQLTTTRTEAAKALEELRRALNDAVRNLNVN